ncbi:hypothetical protein GCM10023336_05460 [Streptomyces similanensis]|uniref:Uncharacterized protein n=1 Tax=Streptomyces similanensis TaxID=1274988 RepID=A0ABP9JVJ3_9ACTN
MGGPATHLTTPTSTSPARSPAGPAARLPALATVFKLVESAQDRWRAISGARPVQSDKTAPLTGDRDAERPVVPAVQRPSSLTIAQIDAGRTAEVYP